MTKIAKNLLTEIITQKMLTSKGFNFDLGDAATNGRIYDVRKALEQGADIHWSNDYALRSASFMGHVPVVKLLIDRGANVHAKGDDALILASIKGYGDIVKMLIVAGSNVNAGNGEALKVAIENGRDNVVQILKRHGAKLENPAEEEKMVRWATKGRIKEIIDVDGNDPREEREKELFWDVLDKRLPLITQKTNQIYVELEKAVDEASKRIAESNILEEEREVLNKLLNTIYDIEQFFKEVSETLQIKGKAFEAIKKYLK